MRILWPYERIKRRFKFTDISLSFFTFCVSLYIHCAILAYEQRRAHRFVNSRLGSSSLLLHLCLWKVYLSIFFILLGLWFVTGVSSVEHLIESRAVTNRLMMRFRHRYVLPCFMTASYHFCQSIRKHFHTTVHGTLLGNEVVMVLLRTREGAGEGSDTMQNK